MTTRVMFVAIALLTSAACAARADGPPQIEVDQTTCAHCSMLVSEPVFAAAYQAAEAAPRIFDDIGCLAAELARADGQRPVRVWVHDFETREWIDGNSAVFVHADALRTPMGGGVIAFRNAAAAERAAVHYKGRVLASLRDVAARH